jgi:hypothetical protein
MPINPGVTNFDSEVGKGTNMRRKDKEISDKFGIDAVQV